MDALEIFTALGTPAGRADPYPHYAALHDLGEAINVAPGSVVVVGYDANNAVLRDPGFRVSDEDRFDHDFPGWRANPVFVQAMDWMLNINGPKHARIRSLIARVFTARRVAGLEPAIARMADELLDAMADRGRGRLDRGVHARLRLPAAGDRDLRADRDSGGGPGRLPAGRARPGQRVRV